MAHEFPAVEAAQLVRSARLDRGWTQEELADAAGMRQPHIAAIESGQRRLSTEALTHILRVADYRPSLPLERHAQTIKDRAATHGIRNVRVFGSIPRGEDSHDSDIDLLVDIEPDRSYLDIAAFIDEVEDLTGFAVDVLLDKPHKPLQRELEAVPL